MTEEDAPLLLSEPSYDTQGDHVLLHAADSACAGHAFVFPAEQAGQHLHGWLTAIQSIADGAGAVGLGEIAQQMIVLQPTELAMAPVAPGRAALVFAFGPVKLAFLLDIDQLGALLEATRQQE